MRKTTLKQKGTKSFKATYKDGPIKDGWVRGKETKFDLISPEHGVMKLCLWCGKEPVWSSITESYDEESNRCKKCAEKQGKTKGEDYPQVNIYQSV